jgi:hypothetical protein
VHNTKGGKQHKRPSEIPANWSVAQIEAYLAKYGKDMTKKQREAIESYLKIQKKLDKIGELNTTIRSLMWWTPAGIIWGAIDEVFGEPIPNAHRPFVIPGLPNPDYKGYY